MLNGNYLSISFEKVAISLAFFTLKNFELLQNVGILRVLKNRELQIREIQGHELQGLPVPTFKVFMKTYFVAFQFLNVYDCIDYTFEVDFTSLTLKKLWGGGIKTRLVQHLPLFSRANL